MEQSIGLGCPSSRALKLQFQLSDKQLGVRTGRAPIRTYALACSRGWLDRPGGTRALASASRSNPGVRGRLRVYRLHHEVGRMGVGAAEAPVMPASLVIADVIPKGIAKRPSIPHSGLGARGRADVFISSSWLAAMLSMAQVFRVAGGRTALLGGTVLRAHARAKRVSRCRRAR